MFNLYLKTLLDVFLRYFIINYVYSVLQHFIYSMLAVPLGFTRCDLSIHFLISSIKVLRKLYRARMGFKKSIDIPCSTVH